MKWGSLLSSGLVFGALLSGGVAHAQAAEPSKPPEKQASKGDVAAAPGSPACPPNAYCQTEEVGPPADAAPPSASDEAAGSSAEADEGDSVVVVQRDDGSTTVELPAPPEGSDPDRPRTFTYVPPTARRPGQVIIYDDGAMPPHLLPGYNDPDGEPPPNRLGRGGRLTKDRADAYRPRRWGINLRANAAILPRYRNSTNNYGMFGVGMSLRYRPVRAFAFDVGADFLGGRDSNGLERQEMPFSASAVLYPNPRSFAQLYFYGGMNWAFARVFSDDFRANLAGGVHDEYTYVGGHAGAGMEFRFTPLFGVSLDAQAYLRTRTDDHKDRFPEFVDVNSGETSNTAVGGLARAGINFWW